jgi:hypothetical protein
MPAVVWLVLAAALAVHAGTLHTEYENCHAWCSKTSCAHAMCTGCGSHVGCPDKFPPPSLPPLFPPAPLLPPFDYATMSPGALHFEASDGQIYANGVGFNIKGVVSSALHHVPPRL